jgi:ABC-2 type transport system ATP-binding protein
VEAARAEGVTGPILSVRALAKRYGERQALRDVSFDVHAGELVAVVGPNGAGKTTLLSIIAGAQRSTSGAVSGSALSDGARRIGWAPQQAAVYSKLTVRENLSLFARLEGVPDAQAAVARMLEQTGLGPRADERVQRLSGGNRQRVNVALGLLADPQLLALDEPTSALDPGQRARLWEFVGVLARRGTSVLFSTHHLGEVRRYASRVIVLADGEVLFDGGARELLGAAGAGAAADDLEAAFLALLRERGHS